MRAKVCILVCCHGNSDYLLRGHTISTQPLTHSFQNPGSTLLQTGQSLVNVGVKTTACLAQATSQTWKLKSMTELWKLLLWQQVD